MITALLLFLAQASAALPVFPAPAMPDSELAEHRGGIRLPNGIDLVLTVQTQTVVDGAVVLRTEFKVDQGAPQIAIYTPRDGAPVLVPATAANGGSTMGTPPALVFDGRGGLAVVRGVNVPVGAVTTGSTAQGAPAGLQASDGNSPFATDNGLVAAMLEGSSKSVSLQGSDYNVTHLVGGAFGSAILNSGNDRVIGTETTISIDLRNAGPDVLGSTMFRVDNLVTGALGSRL